MASIAYIIFVIVFPILFLVMFLYFMAKFAYEEETEYDVERKEWEKRES